MDLQKELLINSEPYSDALVYKLAERNGLDVEMFKEDRRSDLAEKKCFVAISEWSMRWM